MRIRNKTAAAPDSRVKRAGSKVIDRLKSRAGESIGEVLVAVLISAVGLVLLAGMISSTYHLIQSSREKVHDYAASDKTLVEKDGDSGKEGTVVLRIASSGVKLTDNDLTAQVAVVYYENPGIPNKDVISYKVK